LAGYTPRALGARGGELVETVGPGSLCNYSIALANGSACGGRIGNKDYKAGVAHSPIL